MGEVYTKQGQQEQALQSYQQALQIQQDIGDQNGKSLTLKRLGSLYSLQGKTAEAIAALQQSFQIAQAIGARLTVIQTQNILGQLYANQGQNQSAVPLLQQALVNSQQVGDRASEAQALSNLGQLFAKQQQPTLAIAFYKQSINVTEGIRGGLKTLSKAQQESYTQTVADTYRSLADLLLTQGRILEAQQVLELLKIEEIREYTRGKATDSTARRVELSPAEKTVLAKHGSLIDLGQKLYACESKARSCSDAEETALKEQRYALTQEWNATIRTFEKELGSNRAADEYVANPKALIGEEVRDIVNAQPGTILIYPVVLKDKLWILWATQGGIANPIEVPAREVEINRAVLYQFLKYQLQIVHSG